MALETMVSPDFTIFVMATIEVSKSLRPTRPENHFPVLRLSAIYFQKIGQTHAFLELQIVFLLTSRLLFSKTCISAFAFKMGCGFYVIR